MIFCIVSSSKNLDNFLFQKERTHMGRLPHSDDDAQGDLKDGPPQNARVQNLRNLAESLFAVTLEILLLLNLRDLIRQLDDLELEPGELILLHHSLVILLVLANAERQIDAQFLWAHATAGHCPRRVV